MDADRAADMAMRVSTTTSSSMRTEIRVMTRRLILMTFEKGCRWAESGLGYEKSCQRTLVGCAEVDRGELVHRMHTTKRA